MGHEDEVLARRVADAASAHLSDPLDVHAYELLVESVKAWRAWNQPSLDGLDGVGRPSLAEIEAASRAASGVNEPLDEDASNDPQRQPVRLQGALADVISSLRRQSSVTENT